MSTLKFLSKIEILPFFNSMHIKKGSFSISVLAGGLLNQNFFVKTGNKKFVLKVYRPEIDAKKIQEMHRMMRFASGHGLPVPSPQKTEVIKNHVVSIYPYLRGENPPRFRNTESRIHSMGETLGKLHLALNTFRPSLSKPTPSTLASWNPDIFIKDIRAVRSSLIGKNAEMQKEVNHALDTAQSIVSADSWNKTDFLTLPIRICHNDYHIDNILMSNDRITGILDWEKAGWHWRPYEIMRSILWNCRKNESTLNWNLVKIYLTGYKKYATLNLQERELAFECGFRKMLFSLWGIKEYISGRTELRANTRRRGALLKTLNINRQEYTKKIADYLK